MLLEKGNKVQEQNNRLLLCHQILISAANYIPLDQKENFVEKKQLILRTQEIEGLWMGATTTMENSKATS